MAFRSVSDDELHTIARQGLDEGRLPVAGTRIATARRGSGEACYLCGQSIEPRHVECRVIAGHGSAVRFHVLCQAIWQFECIVRRAISWRGR